MPGAQVIRVVEGGRTNAEVVAVSLRVRRVEVVVAGGRIHLRVVPAPVRLVVAVVFGEGSILVRVVAQSKQRVGVDLVDHARSRGATGRVAAAVAGNGDHWVSGGRVRRRQSEQRVGRMHGADRTGGEKARNSDCGERGRGERAPAHHAQERRPPRSPCGANRELIRTCETRLRDVSASRANDGVVCDGCCRLEGRVASKTPPPAS